MSDLKWIKHDGGPCPVPLDTIVRVIGTDGYKWEPHAARFFKEDYPGHEIETSWTNGRLDVYSIVYQVSPQPDPTNTPAIDAHYAKYAIQPMEFSLANGLDPAQHTVIKYVVRYRDKGGIRDLRAAIRVLELMIEREEKVND